MSRNEVKPQDILISLRERSTRARLDAEYQVSLLRKLESDAVAKGFSWYKYIPMPVWAVFTVLAVAFVGLAIALTSFANTINQNVQVAEDSTTSSLSSLPVIKDNTTPLQIAEAVKAAINSESIEELSSYLSEKVYVEYYLTDCCKDLQKDEAMAAIGSQLIESRKPFDFDIDSEALQGIQNLDLENYILGISMDKQVVIGIGMEEGLVRSVVFMPNLKEEIHSVSVTTKDALENGAVVSSGVTLELITVIDTPEDYSCSGSRFYRVQEDAGVVESLWSFEEDTEITFSDAGIYDFSITCIVPESPYLSVQGSFRIIVTLAEVKGASSEAPEPVVLAPVENPAIIGD